MEVEVLSPARRLVKVKAKSIMVPGSLGYMTILPGHTEMISEMNTGTLTVRADDDKEMHYFVSGGYVDISGTTVNVLADVIEGAKEIDLERAQKAKKRAQERLSGKNEETDFVRALKALKRAELRIALLEMIRV
jgi:F-type H+-transporting ATPase subunit epsilon